MSDHMYSLIVVASLSFCRPTPHYHQTFLPLMDNHLSARSEELLQDSKILFQLRKLFNKVFSSQIALLFAKLKHLVTKGTLGF